MNRWISVYFSRTPKASVGGSEDGEEGNQDGDEDEDSVMTIDGVEGGYAWYKNIYHLLNYNHVFKFMGYNNQLMCFDFWFRWRAYFCDKTDKERQIGFLLPDHTGFMALMEKYFYQVLNKHFDSGDTRRWVKKSKT